MDAAEGGNWDGLSPEVVSMIFQHLSVPDLLSCSVVSRSWKKAARDVLKRSQECYAHIKNVPQDIQDLNQMIASTDIMEMINGLHIRNEKAPEEELGDDAIMWYKSIRCSDSTSILQSDEEEGRKLEEAKQKILNVLSGQWRYLDLDMGGYERGYVVGIEKGLLLREITVATSDTLQKLVVGQHRDRNFIPCCAKPFLKLKNIQVRDEHATVCCLDSSLSNFAPNLDKITGVTIRLNVHCPEHRFVLERMKNIRVSIDENVQHGKEREIFRCISGLYTLDLQKRHNQASYEEEDLMSWYSFVFPFVLRSLNTLKELRMFTLGLYHLSIASDGLKFPNLQRLSLATHLNAPMKNEILALKHLNLPDLCPNLEQVELGWENLSHEAVIPVGEPDEVYKSDTPLAIDLKCHDGIYNHKYLELFNTIYPKLSKVRILKLMNVADYEMSKIFWELKSLEYLEIQVLRPLYEIEIGIEALLCGINIEEAQLPLLKYQKMKDKLNSCIVPVRPSLLNAINLKELKISEELERFSTAEMISRSWVTQVTENLPERYVRNVTVTFDGSKGMYNRLNRMRAFTMLRANKIRAGDLG